MKKLLFGATGVLALMSVTSSAQAYVGDWFYDNNSGGSEILQLGDNSDGTTLNLAGSNRYCGKPGVSYQRMRAVISENGNEQIRWWIDRECSDSHVRVCVKNMYGTAACSTYYKEGWE